MTDWLGKTVDRIERTLEDIAETISEILQDLATRNEGWRGHARTIGVLTSVLEEHQKQLGQIETRLSRMEGRQQAEDLVTSSTPWWRDWWAVFFMLATLIPVTLGTMLLAGLLTPDQTLDIAKAAVNGALQSLGLKD